MIVNLDVVDVYNSWKTENTLKNTRNNNLKNAKCQLKGAQFLHLACQGGRLSPVSYATACDGVCTWWWSEENGKREFGRLNLAKEKLERNLKSKDKVKKKWETPSIVNQTKWWKKIIKSRSLQPKK